MCGCGAVKDGMGWMRSIDVGVGGLFGKRTERRKWKVDGRNPSCRLLLWLALTLAKHTMPTWWGSAMTFSPPAAADRLPPHRHIPLAASGPPTTARSHTFSVLRAKFCGLGASRTISPVVAHCELEPSSDAPPDNSLATHRRLPRPTHLPPPTWVASGRRRSRSRPRSSSSATTPSSPSTSRPTSASAMKSPSLPPSGCATRSVLSRPSSPFIRAC